MKTSHRILTALAVGVIAAPGGAATIVQNFSCSGGSYAGPQGCRTVLKQFDAALGTLQSVTIQANGTLNGTANAFAFGAPGTVNTTLSEAFAFKLANAQYTLGSAAANGQFAVTGFNSGDLAGATTTQNFVYTSLADLIGSSTVAYSAAFATPAFSYTASNGGILATDQQWGAAINGTLTYTYAALGAVPEPATWASMIVGFGAIGAFARRRMRRTAARQLAD